MTGGAPPSRGQETSSAGSLDVLEVLYVGVVGVGSELVLLAIARAEDVVAGELNSHDEGDLGPTELDGVDGKVAGLNAVDPGNPYEIAKGKHAAETIGGNVHGGHDRGLVPQGIQNVPGLGTDDNVHGICHGAVSAVLASSESQIKQNPAEKTRSQLHESLDIDLTEDRKCNTRVELSSNEPVVDDVASGTSLGQFAVVGVIGLDREGADIAVGGQEVANEDVCGQELDVVVVDECPDREVGTLEEGTSGGDCEDEHGRGEGIEAVGQAAARGQHSALDFMSGQEGLEGKTESIVAKGCDNSLGVEKASNTRPADFFLELIECESRGVGQGGRDTSRNIVAEEGEDVADEREHKRDANGTQTGIGVSDGSKNIFGRRANSRAAKLVTVGLFFYSH